MRCLNTVTVASALFAAFLITPASAMSVRGAEVANTVVQLEQQNLLTEVQYRRYRGYYGGHGYGGGGVALGAAIIGGAIISGIIANEAARHEAAQNAAIASCSQRYQTYDPASGTYLGRDGLRHPCP